MKRFRVHGYCLVPTECVMTVEAPSPEEAVMIALASRWQDHIDGQGGDDRSAYDWRPDAQDIESPNSVLSRTPSGATDSAAPGIHGSAGGLTGGSPHITEEKR